MKKFFIIAVSSLLTAFACAAADYPVSNIIAGAFLVYAFLSFTKLKTRVSYIWGILMIILFCFFFVRGNPILGVFLETDKNKPSLENNKPGEAG